MTGPRLFSAKMAWMFATACPQFHPPQEFSSTWIIFTFIFRIKKKKKKYIYYQKSNILQGWPILLFLQYSHISQNHRILFKLMGSWGGVQLLPCSEQALPWAQDSSGLYSAGPWNPTGWRRPNLPLPYPHCEAVLGQSLCLSSRPSLSGFSLCLCLPPPHHTLLWNVQLSLLHPFLLLPGMLLGATKALFSKLNQPWSHRLSSHPKGSSPGPSCWLEPGHVYQYPFSVGGPE